MSLKKSDISYLIPSLGLFTAAAFKLLPNISRIVSGIQGIYGLSASIKVISNSLEIKEKKVIEVRKREFKKEINIINLTYSYPGSSQKIFDRVNLKINKNDFVCIVGESGIGKTTLTDLITGLIEAESGEILIDGENLKNILKSIANKIPGVNFDTSGADATRLLNEQLNRGRLDPLQLPGGINMNETRVASTNNNDNSATAINNYHFHGTSDNSITAETFEFFKT